MIRESSLQAEGEKRFYPLSFTLHPSVLFLVKRLVAALLTILCIASLTFLLMKFVPGDPFQDEQGIPQECIQQLKNQHGLNDPLLVQYTRFITNIFMCNLGKSFRQQAYEVTDIIKKAFPISCQLGVQA